MELISTLWLCFGFAINICAMYFSKGTQIFDFMKHNAILKLTYKVKYTSQINVV